MSLSQPSPLLSQPPPPQPSALVPLLLRLLLATVGGPALIAGGGRLDLTVVGSPVPVSLQTGAVVMVGLVLGSRWGAASVMIYLLLGALGLPVLADGASGLAVMTGPSVGYLLGFPLCAAVAGAWRGSPGRDLVSGVLGQLLILGLGVGGLVLRMDLPLDDAITQGALPFVQGALSKALAAALIAALLRPWWPGLLTAGR